MHQHVIIYVSGHVQGVFFRRGAQEIALKNGLVGYAKNMDDGTVLIEAEGRQEDLEKLIAWCATGSPLSQVESVTHEYSDNIQGFEAFDIY